MTAPALSPTGAPACSVDAPVQARQKPHFRTIALIVASAMFMEQMDGTVLATALPTMAHDLSVPATSLSASLTAYLLALAVFIPASGRMADRYGSKTVFMSAIAVFLAGSIACGQARSLSFLIGARFMQGVGGAMMMPVGRLVLLRAVDKKDLVQAMSWLIMPAMVGPIVGPPLGGFIVTYLNWRWIFWLNLPAGLLGLFLVSKYIDQVYGENLPRMDLGGFVLSGLSLGCLLFGFEMSSWPGGLVHALSLIFIGSASGLLYLRHARRRDDAILDLRLMKAPTFRLSLIAGSLTRITQGAQPFLLPLMLQLGFGLSAAASGSITIAGAIGGIAMKSMAPKLLRRFGFRGSLIVNGLLASIGYAICGLFRPDWPLPVMFAVLTASGFFMSFQFSAYNALAYDEIQPDRMSSATSFYSTFQQLMLSMGICAGALALHVSMLIGGGRTIPLLRDFTAAFFIVTAISVSATFWNLRFAPDAGSEISGRRRPR